MDPYYSEWTVDTFNLLDYMFEDLIVITQTIIDRLFIIDESVSG